MVSRPSLVQHSTLARKEYSPDALERLRADVQGDVFLPGENGFDEAMTSWALMIQHAPLLTVLPETANDVARVVTFAHEHDLPVGVLGTGHGTPVPVIDGVLINTSRMQGVTIDPENRTARVDAGVRWGSVVPLAHEHGLAPLNGSAPVVGVVGYTLGGGHGWLARKYGRAADRVIAADIVTATGELRHVTPESDPDLLWAIKGGGGNFGIVTSLEFGLVPVERVFGGSVMYPLAEAKRVYSGFSHWTETMPDDITASISIMRLPPVPDLPPALRGAELVVIRACAVGDLDAGASLIAPMRTLGTPVMDTFAEMPYSAIASISMDPTEPMPAMGATMMLDSLDDDVVDALLGVAGPDADLPLVMVDVRDLRPNAGGLMLYAVGVAMNEEMSAAVKSALGGVREALLPYSTGRAMMNFMGDGNHGGHPVEAAFPEADFSRLRNLKRRYDPENRFRFNHNIAP